MDNIYCSCNSSAKFLQSIEHKQGKKKTGQRFIDFIKMAMPAIVFVFIPKCPVCLAGYIALGTGIGLSLTTATYLRIGLIVVCILSLAYFVAKYAHRYLLKNR
jgi:hypothetical protein